MTMKPERMSNARALLMVADTLQKFDGEPPTPQAVGVLLSKHTLRVKNKNINWMLTDDTALHCSVFLWKLIVPRTATMFAGVVTECE